MYYLFGRGAVNDLLRARCGGAFDQPLSDPALQVAYNRFLDDQSIIEVPIDWCTPRIVDFEGLQAYAPTFCAEKRHHFASNSLTLRERLASDYFDTALSDLSEKEPYIAEIARFCVRLIVINQLSEYTNGTTEDTLGVANFNFRDDFNTLDFQELLVHQLVHMLLFIDDTLAPHMTPGSKEVPIETGLPFVLGGTVFPAYIAFHSYIVAAEILLYRASTGQLSASPKYHRSTARVIRIINALENALASHASLFTARGHEILGRAEQSVAGLLEQASSPSVDPAQHELSR
jgi:hypothetical protein